jgi:hypothetical protein
VHAFRTLQASTHDCSIGNRQEFSFVTSLDIGNKNSLHPSIITMVSSSFLAAASVTSRQFILLACVVALASSCSNYTSCGDCLGEGCSWVPDIGCLDECLADTSCYNTESFLNNTVEEVCGLVEGNTTVPFDCEDYDICGECLSQSCAWVPDIGCLDSCDIIADTACFDANNASISDTCSAAGGQEDDEKLCVTATDCGTCVSTFLSDGATTCQWFAQGSYCSSGCGMNGCGSTNCSATPTDPPSAASGISPAFSLGLGLVAVVFI